MKLEMDWHFTKDEMPEVTEAKPNVVLFVASEAGSYMHVNYSKYGFNTTDWDGTDFELPEEKKGSTAIEVRAWAYVPDEWDDLFYPEVKAFRDAKEAFHDEAV